MEQVLDKLAEHGIVAIFYVITVIYFIKREKKHEEALAALQKIIADKDVVIQGLNNKIHEIGISAITSVKEWTQVLKDTFKS